MTQGQRGARRKAQEEADPMVPPAKGQDVCPGGKIAEENGSGTQKGPGRGEGMTPALQGHAVPWTGRAEKDPEGAVPGRGAQAQVLTDLLIRMKAENAPLGQMGGMGY